MTYQAPWLRLVGKAEGIVLGGVNGGNDHMRDQDDIVGLISTALDSSLEY